MINFFNEVSEGNNFMTALVNCFVGPLDFSEDELLELRKGRDEFIERNKLIS